MTSRTPLALASLSPLLLLLGACTPPTEPEPPGTPDAAPLPDATPPADAAPVPDAAPLPGVNRSLDAYDPVGHRLIMGDCLNHRVVAVDLRTGATEALITQWPWAEDSTICPDDIFVQRDGSKAFTSVRRSYSDPSGERDFCIVEEMVQIDLEHGTVGLLESSEVFCFSGFLDGGEPSRDVRAPLPDHSRERMLYLYQACENFHCERHLRQFESEAEHSEQLFDTLYPPLCDISSSDCELDREPNLRHFAFDPRDPDRSGLFLVADDAPRGTVIDTVNLDTGALTELARVPDEFAGQSFLPHSFRVDAGRERLILLSVETPLGSDERHLGMALDLATGAQELLYSIELPRHSYSGSPCRPTWAIDTRYDRLLLVRPSPENCAEHVYAVSLASGAVSELSFSASAR
ncbi:hypothetical protein [Haliangium ochraceum]|uniref:Lipoprotein n=1 Tax=Haliangium ochraceum (strain DSM 14365 / JCM 11303 / SMP-2) TaxID=502025 RepID=D0LSD4_HALO1|nr:hypothetical protein [Haliangium ochraceum]ACY15633.1 hypothetical protein Hoch_3131 [Haliangium ochraceum DSM 14365]